MNLESPDSERRPPLEPVLPLINVVFLLLIFFMVAGHLAPPQPVKVTTPHSASATTQDDPEQIMLVLKPDGALFFQGKEVDPASLAALLHRQRTEKPTHTGEQDTAHKPEPVRLLADANTSLKTLRGGLQALRDAGVAQVRLVTRSEAPS